MRLTLLDLPTASAGQFALDEDGIVWMRLRTGTWGRGCRADYGSRPAFFLRPSWALSWPPLTLEAFRSSRTLVRTAA
jgi:hypothetical protein